MGRSRFVRVHRGSVSFEVEADLDIEEVMSELSDEVLRKECDERGISLTPKRMDHRETWLDFCEQFRASIQAGDRLHCEVMLVQMLAMAGVPRLTIPTKTDAQKTVGA